MYKPLFQHVDQECVFMGLAYPDGSPLLVPRDVLNEHVYICGQTGSGKTSLGILSLLMQLADKSLKAKRDLNGKIVRSVDNKTLFEEEPRPPILILDLKGEPALFNSARIQAKKAGYEFKFFSIEHGRPGYIFDAFQNLRGLPPIELSETILQALSLVHGPGYGRTYYSSGHRTLLTETLSTIGNQDALTWEILFKQTGLVSKRLDFKPLVKDSAELRNDIYAIKQHRALSANGRRPESIGVIHMPTVLTERQMIYFWLPTSSGETSANEIAKLALYSFERAAKERADAGKRTQSYVFVDEFHRVLGRNLEQLLTQDRSYGISYILSNQYPARLAEEDLDIKRMVHEATRVKQYFTLTDPDEIEEIETASGQTTRLLGSSSQTHGVSHSSTGNVTVTNSTTHGTREVLCPRFDRDIARQVTEEPIGSLIWIQRGKGLATYGGLPIWAQCLWPIHAWQHTLRSSFEKMTWPDAKDEPPLQETMQKTSLNPLRPSGEPRNNVNDADQMMRDVAQKLKSKAEAPATIQATPKQSKKKKKKKGTLAGELERSIGLRDALKDKSP